MRRKWIQCSLPHAIEAIGFTFLDIDTEGSAFNGIAHTEIALSDEDGRVVGYDDDSGSGNLGQLTYGAGTRPAVGDGAAYNGNDCPLAAGTYYLLVRGFGPDLPQVSWSYPGNASTLTGDARINVRTNVGILAGCAVDFNRDGILHVQDLFDYLNAWLAGCP